MLIDFYKKFNITEPTAGLIYEITSPKGIRKPTKKGYSYNLHTGKHYLYDNAPIDLPSGLYWVLNVCKVDGIMTWNHFLFYIDEESVTPVGEFIDVNGTAWIVDALPIIKEVLLEEVVTPVAITLHPPKPVKKNKIGEKVKN